MQKAVANNLEPFEDFSYLFTELPKLGRHYEAKALDPLLPWNLTEKIKPLHEAAWFVLVGWIDGYESYANSGLEIIDNWLLDSPGDTDGVDTILNEMKTIAADLIAKEEVKPDLDTLELI